MTSHLAARVDQLSARVLTRTTEAEGIVSFELVSSDGAPLPPFDAGAHIDVHVSGEIVRQYSLCNDPSERHRYVIAVLRDPQSRGGSVAMHESVRAGDLLPISAPRNHFELKPAKRYLLLAGGIGVTPILAMAKYLAQVDADFDMHYCTRSLERTAFLGHIKGSTFAARVSMHVDAGPGARPADWPALLRNPDPDTHVYMCGPTGFLKHVSAAAAACGWSAEQIHLEYFSNLALDSASDQAFEVRLARSGTAFFVPASKSVVDVLAENGVDIPVSCEQGVCGTCVTRIIEGTPVHRDVYFTDAERARNDQFTPCCSRASTRVLVLDL